MTSETPEPSREQQSPGSASPPAPVELRFPRHKRRHRRGEQPDAEADTEISILSSMLANVIAKKYTNPESAESRAVKINRFVSKRPSSKGDPAESPNPGASVSTSEPALDAVPRLPLIPRRGGLETRARPGLNPFIYVFLILAFSASAYLAGRMTAPQTAAVQTVQVARSPGARASSGWDAAKVERLDRILAADQSGDLEGAFALGSTLKSDAGALPGLDLYLSTLDIRRQQYANAQAQLNKLSAAAGTSPMPTSEIDDRFAFNYARQRQFALASEAFGRASLANPFSAVNFRHWAEALRREGRLDDAIHRFQEELLRYPAGLPNLVDDRMDAEFKIRLCQIEAGQDDELKKALDVHLAEAEPDNFWLLTAAAYALQHGDMNAAFTFLQKAKAGLPADEFNGLLSDYFFRAYAARPEVARFFPPESAERDHDLQTRMIYFVDP